MCNLTDGVTGMIVWSFGEICSAANMMKCLCVFSAMAQKQAVSLGFGLVCGVSRDRMGGKNCVAAIV